MKTFLFVNVVSYVAKMRVNSSFDPYDNRSSFQLYPYTFGGNNNLIKTEVQANQIQRNTKEKGVVKL